jgi:hypothetical protein
MLGLIIWTILIISIVIEVKEIHKHTEEIAELKARIRALEERKP